MKKQNVLFIIIITILVGITSSILFHRKNNKVSIEEKITKIYGLVNEINNNLNELSNTYLKIDVSANDFQSMSKEEIANGINVDKFKFLQETEDIKSKSFNNWPEIVECMNKYYKNSGIFENIQNKFKTLKNYLSDIDPKTDKEKKTYNELKSLCNQLIEYNSAISDSEVGNLVYKERLIKLRDSIKLGLEVIAKSEFNKK